MRGVSSEKLKLLKGLVKRKKVNILGLTETHAASREKVELISSFFRQWTIIQTSLTNARAGTCLLIHPSLKVEAHGTTEDGRCVWAMICQIKIVVTYFPNKAHNRLTFLQDKLYPIFDASTCIFFGDHNCVLQQSDKDSMFKLTRDVIALENLLIENDLVDAAFINGDTTHTFVSSSHGTKSRIDHFFVSEELSSDVKLETIPLPGFDHASLFLEWRPTTKTDTRWIMNSSILPQLDSVIVKKLQSIGRTSTDWDEFKIYVRTCVETLSARSTKRSKKKREDLQEQLSSLWKSGDLGDKYAEISEQLLELELEDYEADSLRARVFFDRNVDTPSGVFTGLVKGRIQQNNMKLRTPTGITEDKEEVGRIMANHLNGVHRNRVMNTQSEFTNHIPVSPHELGGNFTAEEVLAAIEKLRARSSPGCDGFVPSFYIRYAQVLAPYLADLYNFILDVGTAPCDFKTAIIRFIGKKSADLTSPKGWRPISLLNVDFKIMTSVLATRLQTVLPQMTTNLAYIPGRFIIQNVINLHSYFMTKTQANYILLSDFVSAFDSISHDWIRLVVEKARLGPHFAKAVDFLLKDMIAFPIVGSAPVKSKITLNAGVRQGDPLSGPLFNLCVEPLIRAASRNCTDILSYADDMAFVVPSESNLSGLVKLIVDFELVSGLQLNKQKSKIVGIGTTLSCKDIHGIPTADSFEYLGYYFNRSGIDNSLVMRKIDEIVTKLNVLKRLNLSISQKVVVLNTYIFSSLYYYLWATSPPEQVYKHVDKIMRWFLGMKKERFDPSKSYPLHMPLHVFQRPKDQGGFGLTNVKAKALAFKWMLLDRFRVKETPFRNYIFSALSIHKTKKKDNVLSKVKRPPNSATGIIRELFKASQLLQPNFEAQTLEEVFSEKMISYPKTSIHEEFSDRSITTKELALRVQHSLKPIDSLRDGQVLLKAQYQIDYGIIWKKIRVFRKLRPGIKSFLIKLYNAGIYIPSDCPLCGDKVHSCSTIHFLNCSAVDRTIKELCPTVSLHDFIKHPADTFKKCPTLPLALYSIYCVAMNMHFNSEKHVDYIPRVKMKLEEEIKRRDYVLF